MLCSGQCSAFETGCGKVGFVLARSFLSQGKGPQNHEPISIEGLVTEACLGRETVAFGASIA